MGSGAERGLATASSRVKPHSVADRRQPPLEQVPVVGVAEALGGVEQPAADVDGPVGQREHPAVAGQQVVALPQLQVGVDPGVGVALGAEVLADGHPDGPVLVPDQAEGLGEAAGGAVGGHHHLGPDVDRVLALAAHHRPPDQAPLDQRLDHVGGLPQVGPGLGGGPGQQLVEVAAGPGQPERRVVLQLRPGQLDHVPAPVHLEPGAARPALVLLAQPHLVERPDRPGGQPVAAHLVARVGLLLAPAAPWPRPWPDGTRSPTPPAHHR